MPEIKAYENFDLAISAGEAGSYALRVLYTPGAGETAQPVIAPAEPLAEMRARLDELRALTLSRSALRELGAALSAWLMPPAVLDRYRASLARLGPDQGLRVRLRIEPAELHPLPWECCYDVDAGAFLAQDPRTPVVRYLAGPFERHRLSRPQLDVLVAVASPRGYLPLEVLAEYERIEDTLDGLGGRVDVARITATLDGLQDALRSEAGVFHFVGHGGFDLRTGGLLVLENRDGDPAVVDADVLATLFRGSHVRLAVLNACESARADPTDSFAGIAPRLVQAGLPGVVAMQTSLPDEAGRRFARAFYGAVADRWPVDAAVTAGRQAIYVHAPTRPDWVAPVLFLSAPDGVLWEADTVLSGRATPPPAPTGGPSFQFNFQGPVTIQTDTMGGESQEGEVGEKNGGGIA